MSALIETRALTRLDERRQVPLLQPIDFTLHAGDRVSITGASGSGKSVFLRALALLDAPTSGQILWNNQPIGNTQIPHYRSHISYLSQRPALLDGSVEDNLRFPFSLKTLRKRSFDLAAVTTLLGHAGKAPDFLAKRAGDLSGGESQVVSLIRTLQLNPEVLLLDEPTAALDPTSSREVEALIDAWFAGDPARACIWVSHDLDQARRMSDIHLQMSAGVLSGVPQP
ncbi:MULTISPECIES: ABC transporter ATP-binding protein [Pseudomonas]|jgi:putative ABC transport system ATP-binding protein|uniref:Putative iron export ATP-binding protein FetA n=1 Tax=Pseudomonas fluorescens TaxID=294 RepID=A0A5E7QX34_PSEFL|nr:MULTISPECIES: ATP-binding cassette domain-containing protein [Pseudomonas]VVM12834.1 putative iron export ATP-binding protein FetA [Pseudomonas fluorescens]AOE80251.1 ABC transporter ATP-binding protein [Pseudomonas lurida]AVJ39074.1 ABC transporter ATP-binding protein [Pseudomonas lurida]MBC3234522.1 ATP-binding cassette domain-containing protein [Pseudomonas lurida]MBC3240982.1 ATP-binding cassette domain-containing protein [Pseudomonas lurida]